MGSLVQPDRLARRGGGVNGGACAIGERRLDVSELVHVAQVLEIDSLGGVGEVK